MATKHKTDLVLQAKDGFSAVLRSAEGAVGKLSKRLNRLDKNGLSAADRFKDRFKKGTDKFVTRSAQLGGALIAAGAVASIKSFIDYEKALVGVGKTADIEGEELRRFGERFKELSERVPISAKALLGLGQTAAQLGVKGSNNILSFAETIAKLESASAGSLKGEEGATALARILNQTGETGDMANNVKRLASVMVALGNNFATTEGEIASMSNELARTFGRFGGGSTQITGLAGALSSLGFRAEESGGVINQVFTALDTASRKGSKGINALSKLTGIAKENLREAFEKDATSVFIKFVSGLRQAGKDGKNIAKGLQEAFGLSGVRVTGLLGTLSSKFGTLTEAMALATEESKNVGALDKEAGKAFDTTGSKLQMFLNKMENLGSKMGEKMAPGLNKAIDNLEQPLEFLADSISNALEAVFSGEFLDFLKFSFLEMGKTLGSMLKSGITETFLKENDLIDDLATPLGPALSPVVKFAKNLISDDDGKKKPRNAFSQGKEKKEEKGFFSGLFSSDDDKIERKDSKVIRMEDRREGIEKKKDDQKVIIELKGNTDAVSKIDTKNARNTNVNLASGFQG